MTRLLLAYDGSAPAADAIRAAGALFAGAEALVLTVCREPLARHGAGIARIGMPDTVIAGGRGALAVVVGARGRGAASSTLLGSVSSGLAHNADMPVLVARDGAENSGSATAQTTDDDGPRRA